MPPGTLARDVRATLDIDVARAQKGLRDLEKSGQSAERALKQQEDAARGYERQLEKTGSAASTMRRRLEAATRALPKITISADSSEADSKLANLRESLAGLSSQKIGIDLSGTAALEEMRRVKAELEELARTEADPIIRADVQIALREINRVEAELDKLNADTAEVKVDVDNSAALAAVDELGSKAGTLGSLFSDGFGVIGTAGPANAAIAGAAIAALPTVAGVAAAGIVAAIGGGLAAVGLTAAADADRVKFAWSEAASAIKRELGEVAAPLEDSAIHAADVAVAAFGRLKPTLARIFKDLVPDVNRFVDAVGDGVVSLGPSLEKIGDSFGTLLNSLSNQMPSIMSNLSSTFETFAGIMNENPTMLADLVKDATELISAGAEVLSWADEIKVALSLPFGPAGAQAGSDYFYRQIFGGTPQEIAAGMEQFPQIMGQFNHQASLAVSALLGMGGGSQEAAAAVRDLNTALTEHFDPAQRALDAEIRLKQALQEATRASKDKKMGEVDRLQAVQSLTRAIADSSRAEMERTGATTSAGKAFMEQLPRLLEWAGSNKAAQDTINGLAGSLSITIGRTKDGTIAIDRFGKAIQILPNGKKVEIDANTAKGKQQIQDLMLLIARQKGTIDVRVRTIYDTPSGQKALERKAKAAGGIERYAAGGIDYAAAEGMRARPQPPGIVSKPTILFGEGSSGRGATEAFIPYESQFRGRAIELLGRVAEDFGLEVYNRQAARTISDVGESVHVSAGSVTVAMGGALDALDAALGQSGSLTSAITMVGGVGEQMSAGWIDGSAALGDSVTGMSETMSTSVGGLTSSVQLLAEQVAAAAELTTGSRSGGVDATAKETRGKIGHSLKETRGVIAQPKPIVWNDSKIGVHAGGGVDYASTPGGMLQAATLRSVPAGSGGGAGSSAGGGGGGPLFTIEGGFHAAPDQSPYQIAQDLDWIRRGG